MSVEGGTNRATKKIFFFTHCRNVVTSPYNRPKREREIERRKTEKLAGATQHVMYVLLVNSSSKQKKRTSRNQSFG